MTHLSITTNTYYIYIYINKLTKFTKIKQVERNVAANCSERLWYWYSVISIIVGTGLHFMMTPFFLDDPPFLPAFFQILSNPSPPPPPTRSFL